MMYKFRSVLIVIGLFLIQPAVLYSETKSFLIQLENQDRTNLNQYISFFRDDNNQLEFDYILRQPASSFQNFPENNSDTNLGFSSATHWLRFEFENLTSKKVNRFLEFAYTRISYLTFYIPTLDGNYQVIETGNNLPFQTRPYQHRNFIFPLILPPESKQVFFFKVNTTSPLIIPVRLWETNAFHKYERDDYFHQALYFGIAIAMILFNLLLFFSLKDIIYFYYVSFAITMFYSIATKNGLAKEFLWLDSPTISNNSSLTANALTFITFPSFFSRAVKNLYLHTES